MTDPLHALSIRFRSRPRTPPDAQRAVAVASYVVPALLGLSALAAIGGRSSTVGTVGTVGFLITLPLAALLSAVRTWQRRIDTVEATLHGRKLEVAYGAVRFEAPLEVVTVTFETDSLVITHEGQVDVLHPVDPDAIRPWVEAVQRALEAHGRRDEVPAALRRPGRHTE